MATETLTKHHHDAHAEHGHHDAGANKVFGFWIYLMLLLSSITYGMAVIAMNKENKGAVIGWLALTFLFGAGFIGMELYEFHHLIEEGFGPNRSGFLSGFFTLVGTHGLHVTSGLIWMAVLMFQIAKNGLSATNRTRIMCLSLFWHFLDVVWICVFTVVYLMGAM
ncbi:MAG: cytochrome c oxidase subunit 3 [Pantoea sp.]|nr:cytochrome c oxidase subunit 3 [Pantoea sp.]